MRSMWYSHLGYTPPAVCRWGWSTGNWAVWYLWATSESLSDRFVLYLLLKMIIWYYCITHDLHTCMLRPGSCHGAHPHPHPHPHFIIVHSHMELIKMQHILHITKTVPLYRKFKEDLWSGNVCQMCTHLFRFASWLQRDSNHLSAYTQIIKIHVTTSAL